MRVVLCSPFSSGPLRGNIITVQRIARHLSANGCEAVTAPLDCMDQRQLLELVTHQQPNLLHTFHAFHGGQATRLLAQHHRLPYLITMTGSDLYDPFFYQHPATTEALQDAAAITCFDRSAAEQFRTVFPAFTSRLFIIPQGVDLIDADSHVRPRSTHSFIILLPAAIRPVKGILEAIEALSPLATELPHLALWIAGGDLDPAYAARVRQKITTLPWVTLLGEVPHHAMGDLFANCDVMLNHSQFEGGMANTLLEAMAAGKPVLAHDVAGNRSLIRQGKTGWLFKTPQELRCLLRQLATSPELRGVVGQAARDYVTSRFSTRRETTALITLYRQIRDNHRT